jgi:lactoylglutathione lyase
MFQQVDYVMIVVSNMQRSIQFYRDILGLPLKFDTEEWTEFQTGTTILALHGGGIAGGKPEQDESKIAGRCSIGFNVKDVDKTYSDLKEKGVRFVMPPMSRDGEGIRLAVCMDPDGLPVSFAQNLR